VDEPVVVGEAERSRDLQRQPHRFSLWQRSFALDKRLQVLAVDVFEDDELAAVLLAAVDHRDDVRVRELGDRARLAAEALDVIGVRDELLMQHLERDVTLQQPVVRPIDARHAAGADELLQLVALSHQLPHHNAQLCP
jgi:hypothetical protein